MSDLPAENPYAQFKPAQAPAASENPYAQFAPGSPAVSTKQSPASSMWQNLIGTAGQMATAVPRFIQGAVEGVAGDGIPAGKASEFEGGPGRFAGRAVGTGARSAAASLWENLVKAPGKMVTGEMQPGPEAEGAARGMAMGMAGAGGFRPGMTPRAPPMSPEITPLAGPRPSTVQPGSGPATVMSGPQPAAPIARPATVQPGTGPTQMTPAAPGSATPAPTRLEVTPEQPSALGSAIAENKPKAVDSYITDRYRRVVKPSRVGQTSGPEIAQQDQRIMTAVDQIISNRSALSLTDAAGTEIKGALPRSLRQFGEAIDQTKRGLFQKYDAMAGEAGGIGVQVDLAPVIAKLREVAKSPEVADLHPNLATDAETMARNFEARGFYTPSAAQDIIQNLNRTLSGFYRNPTHETVSRASLLAPVASTLRTQLDAAIESAVGPGYQALRQQYGALRSVEKDVAGAVQREANKVPGGLAGTFADLAASEEAIRGVLTLNPKALLTAAGIKAAKQATKYLNDPNHAIERLFQRRLQGPPPPMGRSFDPALMGGVRAGALDMGNDMARRGNGYPSPDIGPAGGRVIQRRTITPQPEP